MDVHSLATQDVLPGDRIILCHEGGVYRSAIYLDSSGTAESPIVYDGRGTAVLAASDLIVGWESLGDGIYSSVRDVQPQQVFFDGAFGNRKQSREELSDDRDWFWTPSVLYVKSAAGNPSTVFTAPGVEAGARNVAVGFDGQAHVTIEGLTVRHANISGFRSWNPGDHLTIRNCVAEWNWHLGIDLSGLSPYSDISIADNVVRYNGTGGIGFFGSGRYSRISGNYCYANGRYQSAEAVFEEQHLWTFGIKLWEFQSDQRGNEVQFNECFDNGRESGRLNQGIGVGVWIDGVPGDPQAPNVVRQNLIHDNSGNGVFIEISSNTIVIGNVLFNNAMSTDGVNEFTPAGIVIDARVDWVSKNNLVLNNTVVGGRCGFKMATYAWNGCSVDDNLIANNIFVGASEHALLAVFGGDNNGLNGSGNVYEFNNLGLETVGFVRWGGDYLDSYETWESAYGQPTWSIEGDPQLAGPSFRSLYLSDASPCRDAGQNLGNGYSECLLEPSLWTDGLETTVQDLLGDGWDVGAYCFSSSSAPLFYDGFETGDLVRWSREPIEPTGSSN